MKLATLILPLFLLVGCAFQNDGRPDRPAKPPTTPPVATNAATMRAPIITCKDGYEATRCALASITGNDLDGGYEWLRKALVAVAAHLQAQRERNNTTATDEVTGRAERAFDELETQR